MSISTLFTRAPCSPQLRTGLGISSRHSSKRDLILRFRVNLTPPSRHLNPGGYIELQDFSFPLRCQDAAAGLTSKFILFNRLFLDIGTRMGWDLQAPLKWRENLEAAGFTDIHIQWFNWPVGPWAKYKKNKLIGKLTFMNFFDMLPAVSPLYQKFLDYTSEEAQTLVAESRKEMRDQKLHFYQPICFCYAKKPGNLPGEVVSKTAPVAAQPGDVHVTVPDASPGTIPEEPAAASLPGDVHAAVPAAAPETIPP
jgi:hypothetical protein